MQPIAAGLEPRLVDVALRIILGRKYYRGRSAVWRSNLCTPESENYVEEMSYTLAGTYSFRVMICKLVVNAKALRWFWASWALPFHLMSMFSTFTKQVPKRTFCHSLLKSEANCPLISLAYLDLMSYRAKSCSKADVAHFAGFLGIQTLLKEELGLLLRCE